MTYMISNRRTLHRTSLFSLLTGTSLCLALATGCSDDDSNEPTPSAAGSDMGSAGSDMGSAGSDMGAAGSDMSEGGAGGNALPASGPTGTIEVLTDDQDAVLNAATAAFRGQDVWFTNFQLPQLFAPTPAPVTPFSIRSVPLAGGAVGETQITLPGDYYPEGVTAHSDGTLFIGSATTGLVYRAVAGATEATEFVAAGVAQRGVIGLTVDEDRELLWFCDSNPLNQTGGALVGVSLADGSETVRHTLPGTTAPAAADAGAPDPDAAAPPPGPFCNDVIVDGDGRLLFTESLGGLIYTVAPNDALTADSATVWLDAPQIGNPAGFGANGLDLVGNRLIVANGGLVSVDPADPSVGIEEITLLNADGTAADALCGADGLATVPGSDNEFIVVENGFCGEGGVSRIIKVTLN